MPSISGIITLVQEDRFKLADNGGGHELFVLSHRARVDGDDLRGFAEARSRVTVRYGDAPDLIARTAHDVLPS